MSLTAKIWISFSAIWFGAELFDYFIPPTNSTLNAALALTAVIVCVANHFEPPNGRAGT